MKQKEETGCKQCKNKLNGTQTVMVVLSIYIFLSSIYGTVKLFGLVKNLF